MSRIPKVALAVVAAVAVAAGAVVVYRETDLLTGSLVVLGALMLAAIAARRAAAHEEKAGMAEWRDETVASAAAAEDLFGDWEVSSPRERSVAAPEAPRPSVPPAPSGASTAPEPAPPAPAASHRELPDLPPAADPSVAISRPLHTGREDTEQAEALVAQLFADDALARATRSDRRTIELEDLAPAMASAGTGSLSSRHSPIDWTGQGGRVDEKVRTSDDILRASEATALPAEASGAVSGSGELARLLAKVEARLRDYD